MSSDPAYLRAFKTFAKTRPSVDASEAMEKEFYGQNDRACGILFASWVEIWVETDIKRVLKPEAPAALFDFEGPLGTFSAKIMMAYSLGLFGQKTNHDLLLIRTMRNEFAHCQLPLKFDTPEVKAVCDHLLIPDIQEVRVTPSYFYSLPDERPDSWYDRDHPKTRFVICCYSIIYHLFDLGRNFKPIQLASSKLP